MPLAVFVPRMAFEKTVLVVGAGLDLAPVAPKHVLTGADEPLRSGDGSLVDDVLSPWWGRV